MSIIIFVRQPLSYLDVPPPFLQFETSTNVSQYHIYVFSLSADTDVNIFFLDLHVKSSVLVILHYADD